MEKGSSAALPEQILMEVEPFYFYNDWTESECMLNCSTEDENNVEVPELLPGFDWSAYSRDRP